MVEPFTKLKSKMTPLDRANVDTDQIVPKQFLKSITRTGFGKYLFYDWRFDKDGKPRAKFILNNPKYAGRQILLTRDNFGSGSSREHAVWAIIDYGFRTIIAPSFADIFYNNCFKSGVLPIKLSHSEVDYLFKNEDLEIEIDLYTQLLNVGSIIMHFEVDKFKKKLLLAGLDDIGVTLQFEHQIAEYEKTKNVFVPNALYDKI
jgi:3-isopropylmalate/(R)-2-methylmalate dehydratase small subunit